RRTRVRSQRSATRSRERCSRRSKTRRGSPGSTRRARTRRSRSTSTPRRAGGEAARPEPRGKVETVSVQRTPMTRSGYEKLKEELERLKRVERHAITKAIAEARAHGDLAENAEYHAARERQSFVEGRIAELETKVGGADLRLELGDPPLDEALPLAT